MQTLQADFSKAIEVSKMAAGAQNYPSPALYIVSTPIGNLADISLRALYILSIVDYIACEDTRHTKPMLTAWGIDNKSLLAVHEHNENEAAEQIIGFLNGGARVALVSDAGTPAISDPGAKIVNHCKNAGIRVIPIPGASSPVTLLSAAGILDNAWFFYGFLPAKSGERGRELKKIINENRAVILLESPHRIKTLVADLKDLGNRRLTIGRELTKQFEQITTILCCDFENWLNESVNHQKGEFSIVLHAPENIDLEDNDFKNQLFSIKVDDLLKSLLSELPLKTAVKMAVEITGASKNDLYNLALDIKENL